jgi:HSP20 family protein
MSKLVRWTPFHNSIFNDFDRLFDTTLRTPAAVAHDWSIALDVTENEDAYVVKAIVPGINPDDLDVTLENNVLTLKGEVKSDETVEGEQVHIRERRYGSFSRSIRFPVDVNGESVSASYEHGILTLEVPKAEEVKPKRIEVKVS